jgi:hypothetical protein
MYVIASSGLRTSNVIARSPPRQFATTRRLVAMGWAVLRSGLAPFDLPNDGIAHIVLPVNNTAVGVVLTLHPQMQTELARIGKFAG